MNKIEMIMYYFNVVIKKTDNGYLIFNYSVNNRQRHHLINVLNNHNLKPKVDDEDNILITL